MKIKAKFIGTNDPSTSNMIYINGETYHLLVDTATLSGSFTIGNIVHSIGVVGREYLDSRCEYGSISSFARNWEVDSIETGGTPLMNFHNKDSADALSAHSQIYQSFVSYLRDKKLKSILS